MKPPVCQQNEGELHAAAKRKGLVLHTCEVTFESGQLKMLVGHDNTMIEWRRAWSGIERGVDRQAVHEQLIDSLLADARAVMQ